MCVSGNIHGTPLWKATGSSSEADKRVSEIYYGGFYSKCVPALLTYRHLVFRFVESPLYLFSITSSSGNKTRGKSCRSCLSIISGCKGIG